ncbi:uncharacterized protein LOC121246495 [Juglans microcarpa x Juglans regia]|uniref:uncharacterized protein LOC121246495 n=1 Tax=Juglans microcarpa x Juglans regia TaxID=2249226 RepID=UPI001B7EAFA9|nr:uncharacterized protein LOC121246495 [Juglans microcarpa x Juglans regia]
MEEEELAKRWERLNLSREDSDVFPVSTEVMKDMEDRGKLRIIGGVMTDKGINHQAFRITMSQVWRLEDWVKFKEMGDHMFLIEFQSLPDKERVLAGRPWSFDRKLLSLQEVDEDVPIGAIQFKFEPFWVQMHNLPMSVMNEEMREQFGSLIGKVIRVMRI